MIKHDPEESNTLKPLKAPAPLPIPDVQTHLGILRDLIYSGDRDALALHCLKHWPAFVGAEAQAPCVEYLEQTYRWDGGVMRLLSQGVMGGWTCEWFTEPSGRYLGMTKIPEVDPERHAVTLSALGSEVWLHDFEDAEHVVWSPGRRVKRDPRSDGDDLLNGRLIVHLNQLSYGLLARDIEASR